MLLTLIAVVIFGFILIPDSFKQLIVNKFLGISADTVADVILPKDKLGIFGLPDDSAANDLGAGWTRAGLLWKNYDQNPGIFDQQQENLVATNTLYTIRAVSGTKTNCYIDPATLNKYRSRLTQEQLANPATVMSCFPKDMAEYNNFISNLIGKYKGSVQAWQIENEVFGQQINYWSGDKTAGEIDNYLTLLKNASREIKKADPSATILAAGIILPNPAEFDDNGYLLPINGNEKAKLVAQTVEKNVSKLLQTDCADFDIIDFHFYHTIESIPNRVKWLKRLMAQTNCAKPIWTTEESGPDPDDPAYQGALSIQNMPKESAKDLPLRMRALADAGVEKIFYLPYQDYSLNTLTKNVGLVDKFNRKKPLYTIFQRVSGVKSYSSISPDDATKPPADDASLPSPDKSVAAKIDSSLGTFIPKNNPAPNFPVSADELVALVFKIVFAAAGVIFLTMMLIGGISYLTAGGAEEGITNAKKMMINAIIGLIITLSSYAIGMWIWQVVGLL